jgi:sporulation protein YlmC with PRC-barrel domain
MLKTKRISDTYDMKVFTDHGEYFGDVEECVMTINKTFGWRVKATRGSSLGKLLGSAKGVIVPHQLVRAIGDIFIINKAAIPSFGEEEEGEKEEEGREVEEQTI